MPLFVLVQLCQVRAVQNEDQITRNCFYFFKNQAKVHFQLLKREVLVTLLYN